LELLFNFVPPAPSGDVKLRQAGAVVVIPFGGHELDQPVGVVNQYLAALAEEWARALDCQILTQWEIAQALPITPQPKSIVGEEGDFHINTREFFEQVLERVGDRPIIVIAQAAHARRVDWVCWRLGLKPLWPKLGKPI